MAPIVSILPSAASEPGALDGFSITCTFCAARGYRTVGGSSLETLARQEAAGHAAWHATRGDR